jgi:uncharacterized protein (DUF885 family)
MNTSARAFSVKKAILGMLALVVVAAGVWVSKLVWFKPFDIDHFYDRSFFRFVLNSPEFMSQLRIFPSSIEWYEDDLDDASIERQRRDAESTRRTLATLRDYDRADQTPEQLLSTDILDWFLDQQVRGEPYLFYGYPVNQLFGVQNNLPEFMIETHQINSEDDAEDYVARLGKFDVKFGQVIEDLKHREELGVVPPVFVVEKVLKEMRAFVATPVAESPLYTSFVERAGKVERLDQARRDALAAEVAAAIENDVYPAYRELIAHFEALGARATHDAGVWKFPDGDEHYAWALRGFTTTDYTPEQVHLLGLEQVERISAEMRTILDAQGHTGGTVGEWMAKLNADPRFLYPDTDEGKAHVIADFQRIIDEVDKATDRTFNLRPAMGVEVKRVPEFREKTAPGAYYNDPPRDGSRPGTFYINLRNTAEVAKFGMRTLAYHEAIPGHHFQIAIAQKLEGVPQFRTFGLFTAYVEGWALYAEQVAAEMGLMDDPYDRLGHLQAALFRATRLVVDTGLHHKRWTREQAIDYMRATTGMTETDVVAEIERYIVMPGQACAYMVGKLKLLELRGRAQAALGEKFDLKEFHDVVLKNGAVPLSILERLVDEWIASKQATG